jgi:UDP-2,4-diacetamido-2,4,6-trideoxy-beta-L-altropyranose hydrolase
MVQAMRVAFRTDASLQIGTGHVMRCLTLADALTAQGAQCAFICREHPGNLIEFIKNKGHTVAVLPLVEAQTDQVDSLSHSHWLGCSQAQDAAACAPWLQVLQPDWLVVDHYALDACWEATLQPFIGKLMVIDDCADRFHVCDVLLDQNMVADMDVRYLGKMPRRCTCLLGPHYALLRPEFSALRAFSLGRRQTPELKRLLVFMGGSDADNDTGKVVDGIKLSKINWHHVDVVVGQSFPAIQSLKQSLESLKSATLHIQTPHMARLMAAADLAITGGGTVTWEKCTLGLPSFVVIQGTNQRPIATIMHERGAQYTLGHAADLTPSTYAAYLDAVQPKELTSMARVASAICAGDGVAVVLNTMEIQA